MKTIQIRATLCAIALLFTFALSAENFSKPNNDPTACYSFNGKQKKQKHHKKNRNPKSARSRKGKTAQHCDAY